MTNPVANLHRAARAKAALTAIVEETYADTSIDQMDSEELHDAIADLISDLLHLAVYALLDAERILTQASARANFSAERAEA